MATPSSGNLTWAFDPYNVATSDASGGYSFVDLGGGVAPTFTCPRDGFWAVVSSVGLQTGATATDTFLNDSSVTVGWGTVYNRMVPAFGTSNFFSGTFSGVFKLAAGDTIQQFVQWSSHDTFSIFGPSFSYKDDNFLSIYWLGA